MLLACFRQFVRVSAVHKHLATSKKDINHIFTNFAHLSFMSLYPNGKKIPVPIKYNVLSKYISSSYEFAHLQITNLICKHLSEKLITT